jgi:outer membrane protein assembly factor BamB
MPSLLLAVVQALDPQGGVAVRVGAGDGAAEIALARTGRFVVQTLCASEEEAARLRRRFAEAGVLGPASADTRTDPACLPYADRLVSLLLLDADVPESEISRVVSPGGVVRRLPDGTARTLPWPEGLDDWTHFDYGPEGNGVSRDRVAGPALQLQWAFTGQPIRLGGNPAGYRVLTGLRVAGGRVFHEWNAEEKGPGFYTGRDAWNGVPLWTLPASASRNRKEWQFVATREAVYAFLEKNGVLAAVDPGSGRTLRTYPEAPKLSDEVNLSAVRVSGSTLLVSSEDTVAVLDAATGALRWRRRDEGKLLVFPSLADRVYVLLAEDRKKAHYSRWPYIKTEALLALDRETGKELWRCEEIRGADVGQVVAADGMLVLFGSGAIGGGKEPFIGRVDPAGGKLLWRSTFKTEYNRFGYNLLVRDGRPLYADAWRIYAPDPETGIETVTFDDGGYNMRCSRFAATADWLIYGYTAFVGRDGNALVQSATRGGCAQGLVPAHGMLYFTPQACHCFTMLRGHLALTPEPVPPPLDDAVRLRKGVPSPGPGIAAAPPAGPVLDDAARSQGGLARRGPGGEPGGRYAVRGARLEARDAAGAVLWSFLAAARIAAAPIVDGDRLFIASHDGRIHSLDPATGAPRWSFLAAPSERRIVVDGELESSWPVYGLMLHDGLLRASAGLHPELGGGIALWGLDPATGQPRWKRTLRRESVRLPAGERKRPPMPTNRVVNGVLEADGRMLKLAGWTFDPSLSDDELGRLLTTPPPKKK